MGRYVTESLTEVLQTLTDVTNDATNANGVIWWPNLQLMQVAPSGGQICK